MHTGKYSTLHGGEEKEGSGVDSRGAQGGGEEAIEGAYGEC